MATVQTSITKLLDKHGVAYRVLPHTEPVFTVEAAARQRGVVSGAMVKSILLCDQDGRYVMACVTGDARVDPRAVRAQLPAEWKRLRFATGEEILAVTGCVQGAVAPLGLPKDLPVIFDEAIARQEMVSISSGDAMAGLELRSQNLIAIAGARLAPIAEVSHGQSQPGSESPSPQSHKDTKARLARLRRNHQSLLPSCLCGETAWGKTMIRISRDQVVYDFDKTHPPVATIDSGTELLFETWDARTGTVRSERDLLDHPHPKGPNPATGPVAIRGAEPGDAVVVEILGITLASRGFTGIRPKAGVLGHLTHNYRTKVFDIMDGKVVFNDRFTFPVRPMVGVIGTAPASGSIGNLHPGPHGGNMDNNDVRVGATVHLPVFVPGALLAIGDVHASMGDGEISVTALEICGEVRVRVDLEKNEGIARPWIEFPDSWITTGDGPGIADAIRVACEEMAVLLQRRLAISVEDAHMLMSIRADVKVSQCCDPAMIAATARVVMPKL